MAELGPAQPQLVNLILFEQYVSVFNFYVLYKDSGFVLSSTGKCSEYQGSSLGVYDVAIDDSDPDKRVYKQRGGRHYLFKKDDFWAVGTKIGGTKHTLWTYNILSTGTEWYYSGNGRWNNDDNTLKFISLTSDSCILSSSLIISSSGPAASALPEYLGVFNQLPNMFSAGRPIWKNNHGKVLRIKPEYTSFSVRDDLTASGARIRSGSGPTCPTDEEAGHSLRFDYRGWHYWTGSTWVTDETISIEIR